MMKFIILFLTIFCFQLNAESFGQKVTLKGKEVSVEEVFEQIYNQTGYQFIYGYGILEYTHKLNLQFKNAPLKEVLAYCFKDQPFTYTVIDSTIILKKKPGYSLWTEREHEVLGRVIDSVTGRPLAGASVHIRGTDRGTSTDNNGRFRLTVPDDKAILTISYIGYTSKVIPVGSASRINIKLVPHSKSLDQMVVVAYGSQNKSSFTGSLGVLKPEAYQGAPRENVVQSLQGNVAGVRVARGNGQAGAAINVHIRGKGSINASSAPLYVVDGIPIETSTGIDYDSYGGYSTSGLAGINPDDIASVTVLKDAEATSIYGSRAANGVVIITTKEGESGKSKIHFSAQYGINKMAIQKRNRPLNTRQMLELLREGWVNAGKDITNFDAELKKRGIDTSQNTDWMDVLMRTGSFQQYYLSVSGGSEKTQYLASGGYYDTKGTVKGLHYKRGTARMKLKTQPAKRLTLNAGLSSYYQETLGAQRTSSWLASPVRAIYRVQPWVPVYNPDGTYNFGFNTTYNPLAVINETTHKGATYKIKGNVGAKLDIIDGLTFETKEAISLIYGETDMHFPGGFGWGRNTNGRGYIRTSLYKVWTTSNLLRYKHSFHSDHHMEAFVGYEAQDNIHTGSYSEATDFIPNLETLLAASTPAIVSSSNTQHSIVGAFLHVNYDFNNNYFLSASLRRDGSSRFGAQRRFGTFGSVGIAWNIKNTLLKEASVVSAIKLRSSYGVNGNQGISNYESTGRYGSGYDYAGHAGYAFTQFENPLLTWEQNKPFDIGVDFGFFEDRLTGSIDYYERNTNRLLLDRPIPGTSGLTTYTVNFGSMKNSGWEISLSSHNIVSESGKGLNWNTDFNISTLKNKITKLPNTLITDHYIREVGGDFYTWYLPAYAGADPETGVKTWYSAADKSETTTDYEDAVRIKYGSSIPKFYGGLTNTLTFRDFKLSFLLYYSWGNEIYDLRGTVSNSDGSKGFDPQGKLSRYTYENRWRKPGDQTDVPKIIFDGEAPHKSSRWLVDGSYIRLRDISLSYNLPDEILNTIGIQSASIYMRANNLFTYIKDDRLVYDPEQSIEGQQAMRTPTNKTVVLGIDINL